MKKKKISIEVSDRLFDHLKTIQNATELVLGRRVTLGYLVRQALINQYKFGDLTIKIEDTSSIYQAIVEEDGVPILK